MKAFVPPARRRGEPPCGRHESIAVGKESRCRVDELCTVRCGSWRLRATRALEAPGKDAHRWR
eukprot:6205911-Pleurochrysis_carterae.AAC.1